MISGLSSGRAFTLLRAAVDRFVEAETLNPSLESLALIRNQIEASGLPRAAAISAKVEALQHEPQSSPIFEIKPKFISPSDWAAAVDCMQALDRDDWPLPSVAAQVIQETVDTIFATFRAEHPSSSATMGADDLNPVIVFVICRSAVRWLPMFVEMMSWLCPMDGETGYNVIMMNSMLAYIEHGLQVPEHLIDDPEDDGDPDESLVAPRAGQMPESEPEPEPEHEHEPEAEPELTAEPTEDCRVSVRVGVDDVDGKDVYRVGIFIGATAVHQLSGRYSELDKRFSKLPSVLGKFCKAKFPAKDFISSNVSKRKSAASREKNSEKRIREFTLFFSAVLDVTCVYGEATQDLSHTATQSLIAALRRVHSELGIDAAGSRRLIEAYERMLRATEPEPQQEEEVEFEDGEEGLGRTRSKVLRQSMRKSNATKKDGQELTTSVELMGPAGTQEYWARLRSEAILCYNSDRDAKPVATVSLAGQIILQDNVMQIDSGSAGTTIIVFLKGKAEADKWLRQIEASGADAGGGKKDERPRRKKKGKGECAGVYAVTAHPCAVKRASHRRWVCGERPRAARIAGT